MRLPNDSAQALVSGDLQMLKQLATNLFQNFCRHTAEGSSLVVSVAFDTQCNPILTFADNGPGIPRSEWSKVFDAFYRLDSSRSDQGSGLGLALVRSIAIRHGATIRLGDNDPGLIVEVVFPRIE